MTTMLATQIVRDDAMDVGFRIATFVWTIWWNLDWQRYIKFYRVSGPPYRRSLEIGFRVFFALCAIGAGDDLVRHLLETSRPAGFYLSALRVAAMWLVAIVLMVKTVEWFGKMRRPKLQAPKKSL